MIIKETTSHEADGAFMYIPTWRSQFWIIRRFCRDNIIRSEVRNLRQRAFYFYLILRLGFLSNNYKFGSLSRAQKQGRKQAYSCERQVKKVLIDILVWIESTEVMYIEMVHAIKANHEKIKQYSEASYLRSIT